MARAPGFIEGCTFAEGQEVKRGDLSFWSNKKRMRRGLTNKNALAFSSVFRKSCKGMYLERVFMVRAPDFATFVFICSVLIGCDNKPIGNVSATPPPVTVSRPLQKTITEWDEYTGRFEAIATVEVRARVSGFIDSINFREGQIVKQGDLLFVIDQRPYKIAVDQAKADLERARAKLEIATSDVERATPLVRNQTVTEREFDTRRSNSTRRTRRRRFGRGCTQTSRTQPRMERGPRAYFRQDLLPSRRCRQSDHWRRDGRHGLDIDCHDRPNSLRL